MDSNTALHTYIQYIINYFILFFDFTVSKQTKSYVFTT